MTQPVAATAERLLASMSRSEKVAYLKDRGWVRTESDGAQTWVSPDGSEAGTLAYSTRRALGLLDPGGLCGQVCDGCHASTDEIAERGHRGSCDEAGVHAVVACRDESLPWPDCSRNVPPGSPELPLGSRTREGRVAVVDLIADGLCSALCLLAREEGGQCRCRCHGQWHGALADATVPEVGSGGWWERCGRGGWDVSHCPQVRSKRDDFRLWREAKTRGDPVRWVETYHPRSVGFIVLWDAAPMRLRVRELMTRWPEREAHLLNRMTHRLMEQGRVQRGAVAPGEHLSWAGFSNLDEARTVALIVGECFSGNPCGAVRAIEVMEGRPDPAAVGVDPQRGYPDTLAYCDNPASDWPRRRGQP